MSKKLLYLLGILLTIIVGTILHFYFSCDCGGRSGSQGTFKADNSVVAVPGEKNVVVKEAPSDSTNKVKLTELRQKLQAAPLILYYDVNQSELTLNQDERDKLAEITGYLKEVPEAGVTVTGHTDNTGTRDSNMKLGQERADRVKAWLEQNGISGNNITCISKGPDEQAADNSRPEGRAKNRRTVILIK